MKKFFVGSLAVLGGAFVLLMILTGIGLWYADHEGEVDHATVDIKVNVSGGTAAGFAGSLWAGGAPRNVQGVSPATYTVTTKTQGSRAFVAVVESKDRASPDHPLTVELDCGLGSPPRKQSTNADFGVITISCE